MAPPRPAASMMITAPTTGEPKSDEIAAKLPAAAIIPSACWGTSFLTSRIARIPRPTPSAISGASGPSTSPRPTVARAASSTPGRSIGCVGVPPTARPSAGTWPPRPGSRLIAKATSVPARASHGSGHHRERCRIPDPAGDRRTRRAGCSRWPRGSPRPRATRPGRSPPRSQAAPDTACSGGASRDRSAGSGPDPSRARILRQPAF